jgi:hypothetical protein
MEMKMNDNSRNTVQKLQNYYKIIYDKWFLEAFPSYISVAYDLYFPEAGNPQRINLLISLTKASPEEGINLIQPYQLEITLGQLSAPRARGASEPIGLLPRTYSYDENIQGIIERNLSDFIVGLIYKELVDSKEDLIIVQGPFSPKLIGRLGYRHFDRNLTFASITFKNEWFPLEIPEWNQRLNQNFNYKYAINIEKKSRGVKENFFYQLADYGTSNGLQEVLKSWILRDTDKNNTVLIVEIFCQFPTDPTPILSGGKNYWIKKLEKVQNSLKLPAVVFDQGKPVWLPFGLACAVDNCKTRTRKYSIKELELTLPEPWNYLRFYEEDIDEMYKNGWEATEIAGRRSLLYLAMFSDEIYSTIASTLKLTPAKNEVHRGQNLSSYISKNKMEGNWQLKRWRGII